MERRWSKHRGSKHRAWVGPLAVGCGFAFAAPMAHATAACSTEALAGFAVSGVTITSADMVAASGATPAFCAVVGQVATSSDNAPAGSAGFELRLPANWNKKFLFYGVGGLAGATYADISVNPADQQSALAKGYATAITDTGHTGSGTDASWALLSPGQPDSAKLTDYYYRAVHQVTVAGKQLTQRFYDQAVQQAYFDGCSNGGRQALVEATRFPDDYDGIIAGDPFFDIRSMLVGARMAKQQLSPETYIPAMLLPFVDAAVNASCDKADGVADGLIQNPAACSFDPNSLICAPGQTTSCLSAGQAATLGAYFGAVRSVFGALVYPGFAVSNLSTSSTGPLSGGGADAWTTGWTPPASFTAAEPWGNNGFDPAPYGYQFADHITQSIVTRDPAYNLRNYPVSADGYISFPALIGFDMRTWAGSATVPAAYRRFLGSGRKLILYHGYSDPVLTPFRTTWLYDQLASDAGGYAPLQRSARLFMVPGMQHCLGGPGPNVFDTLTPLEAWVEQGIAPASIPAAHYANNDPAQAADRTMPLCPYPTQATFNGTGDVNAAASWSCAPNQKALEVGQSGEQAGLTVR